MGLGAWGRGVPGRVFQLGDSMCEGPEVRGTACLRTQRKDHCECSVAVSETESVMFLPPRLEKQPWVGVVWGRVLLRSETFGLHCPRPP